MQMLTVPGPTALLYVLIGVTIVLIATIIFRPSLTATREGKQLAFIVYFFLPVVVASMGASEHLERSKETQFCLSCHVMDPYGRSLYIDDAMHVPAAHFQNTPASPATRLATRAIPTTSCMARFSRSFAASVTFTSSILEPFRKPSSSAIPTTIASARIAMTAHARSKKAPYTAPILPL